MTTVYFNSHSCHVSDLIHADAELIAEFSRVNGIGPDGRVYQGQAFTLDLSETYAPSIIRTLNQQAIHERSWLMDAAAAEGEELHREAEFWEKYLTEEELSGVLSLIGGSGPAFRAKFENISRFHKALVRYENALIAIQNPAAAGTPGAGARNSIARRNAIQAYDVLISEHRSAMTQLSPVIMRTKNRGSAINNAHRGITLASRSRGRLHADTRIFVADLFQAHRLKKFSQFMSRVATPLSLAADASIRAGKVRGVSNADGNWHRESVKQIAGFGGSALGGGGAGAMTFAAFGGKAKVVALVALGGPVSWALIGCIVLVAAGAGYYAAKAGGSVGEIIGGRIYDGV
ncbi:hypothetical protein [Nitrincola alkalilacustris]|uniref:hypothetical protein n=1 Tax=Nitrincola alkalilacustris TaxID=1571224 RepID=UPI00124F37B6|nr:hypothetical protein [Nitrincola alkalilacustris]